MHTNSDILTNPALLISLKKTTDTIQNHKPHLVSSNLSRKDFDIFLRLNCSILCNVIVERKEKEKEKIL